MVFSKVSENLIRPKKGDKIINLPVTFDYNGGRKETAKSRIFVVCILFVVGVIVSIGIATSKGGFILLNILYSVLFMYGVMLIIRFPLLGEHKIRNRMSKMVESDYQINTKSFWGIYDIDDVYPYYAHMRNGKTALYIRFDKDVTLGKVDDAEFEHYEAIGDAYNLAGSKKINMCHVDYMDNIGSDTRLEECFNRLSDVKNPDLRDLLTDVYSNIQEDMNSRVSTFDVFVFTFNSNESLFWYNIQQIIACMLEANYVSFKILNIDDLRDLAKSLNNLHDFSVVDAQSAVFESKGYAGVVPIKLVKCDGTVVIFNKTVEEKRAELQNMSKEVSRKETLSNQRGSKSSKGKVDEIDIFD